MLRIYHAKLIEKYQENVCYKRLLSDAAQCSLLIKNITLSYFVEALNIGDYSSDIILSNKLQASNPGGSLDEDEKDCSIWGRDFLFTFFCHILKIWLVILGIIFNFTNFSITVIFLFFLILKLKNKLQFSPSLAVRR